MADGKYGRLFTEADVAKLIRAAYELGYDDAQVPGALGYDHAELSTLVESEGPLTFSPDEPLFLLRGQDAAAPGALDGDGYLDECGRVGAPKGHWLNAAGRALEIREWQAQHPDRVKVPD